MKYNSIREYFYKIQNLLYVFILTPLVALVVLYWQFLGGNLHGPLYGELMTSQILLVSMGVIVFSDWMISFVVFNKKLQSIRKIQSLGARLDQYYAVTIMRFAIILSGSMVLAVGFYLTENQSFSIMAISNLLLVLVCWPLPSKVCNDLRLKGDERTLIYHKKDRLH